MKRVHAIAIPLIIIVIVFLATAFTPLFILHAVSTDKNSYPPGEKVIIASSDFGFGMYCTCQGPQLEIYRFADEKWEKIPRYHPLERGVFQCVNGTLYHQSNGAMMCDVVSCKTPGFVNEQGETKWDIKIWKGEEGVCGNETYTYYEKVDASKGTYKAKYGNAEAIFYIE